MKTFYILIAVILFIILVCIAWSALSLERIDSQLEQWDKIIEEAER